MSPFVAAKTAIDYVRNMISQADGEELEVYQAFLEEFDAEIEGWEMRVQELEDGNED